MVKKFSVLLAAVLIFGSSLHGQGPRRIVLGDWPELRGPNRDGVSKEKNLPEKWALNGENFLWRVRCSRPTSPAPMRKNLSAPNTPVPGAAGPHRGSCFPAPPFRPGCG